MVVLIVVVQVVPSIANVVGIKKVKCFLVAILGNRWLGTV